MELQLCTFFLGLPLLLGWGVTQIPVSSEKTSTEASPWSKLVISKNLSFSCNLKMFGSNASSTSVHTLRPSDLKLVASIGIKETLPVQSTVSDMEKLNRTEKMYQEVSLRVGTVLSDILGYFNPSILKFSCTPRRGMTPQPGAEHLCSQAAELTRSMKENLQLDFEKDWKLINVFFHNAHRCYLCPAAGQQSFVTSAMNKLAKTLDYLHHEVPRTFVNLVDLTEVLDFSALSETGTQGSNNTESCRCSEETVQSKAVAWWAYQETWERVLASSTYNQEETFALVFQPLSYETNLSPLLKEPQLDPSLLGVHLWNSMMEPAGQKGRPSSARERRLVKCPQKEHPYLFTYWNSNVQPRLPVNYAALTEEAFSLPCSDKNPSSIDPLSAHRLKPGDIKVIAAVGDSLTAANGAKARFLFISDIFTEYRGSSWSIGGDETLKTVVTLPNILRQFNSKLKGYSIGTGNQNSDGARLNQAVAGARSRDMPDQAKEIIRRMKNDKTINYKKDWKLLTMFIGGNDLCHSCIEKPHLTPEGFRYNIQVALDILHAEVPQMFVNMVLPLDITSLREISRRETSRPCPTFFQKKNCPCIFNLDEDSQEYGQVVMDNKRYQEQIEELVATGRYDTRDDFTVVLQPFFERLQVPTTKDGKIDVTYFAPDCLLFSKKTHGKAATALWRNMLEPVGQKTRQHNFMSINTIVCPSQSKPFLSTSKNSIKAFGSILKCRDFSPSPTIPTSVHSLKPGDIKIVAALGDFMIAGTGIGARQGYDRDLTIDYRGLSFSAGGDHNLASVTTLPNILRIFNVNLTGFAISTGDARSINAGFNQAVTRAKAKDLIRQAQILIQRMKNDKRISIINDWKVITVLIGNSDLCDFCLNLDVHSEEKFLNHIRIGLDYLHTWMPRTLVNLVDFMDPKIQRQMFATNPKLCPLYKISKSCNCILSPKMGFSEILRVENMARNYKIALHNLVASGRYDSRNDFTVVLQPFFRNLHFPILQNRSMDLSFFAPDCFHPNQKFHTQLAKALWANMVQPLGKKRESLNVGYPVTLTCPEDYPDSPFLKTRSQNDYQYHPLVDQDWGSDFNCNGLKPSKEIPNSVHRLRPGDIKVVAAMGDWITTALGASPDNNSQIVSWNGLSWSIGGDKNLEKQTTLPNILRKFNPSLLGFSGGTWKELTGLNVANENARARDLPMQATRLLRLMDINPDINIANDWKLITIFIGLNDLCDFCINQNPDIAETFITQIDETLGIFYKKLPRVFINLVEIMQVAPMYKDQGGKCAKNAVTQISCPCFKISGESLPEDKLEKLNLDLQNAVFNLSFKKEYQKREDFTVVIQPFFRNSVFPRNKKGEIDSTFFSEDCFHFSARSHNEMAIALWNNMLEPVGLKSISHDFTQDRKKLKCPVASNPYLFTEKNSALESNRNLFLIALLLFSLPIVIFLVVKIYRWITNNWNSPKVQNEETVNETEMTFRAEMTSQAEMSTEVESEEEERIYWPAGLL